MKKGTKNVPAVKEKKAVVKVVEGVRAISSVDPQALLAQAIDKNLPIESMERLLAMRREMKQEWAKEQYFNALAGFQHECPVVAKEKKVPNKKKDNEKEATTKYTYAPIEDIVSVVKEHLEKWGFSYTFKSRQEDGFYTAICVAHHRDGHEEQTEFKVPTSFPEYMNMSGAQMQGASCTFADRYAFKNSFGIVTKGEDTDAGGEDRTPIRTPQAKKPDAAIPTTHETVNYAGSKAEFDTLMDATENAPGVGRVAIFTENETIDWRHVANEARSDKVALAKVFADIRAVVDSRRKAIRGDKA
jgi:hypothetical protein